MSGMLDILRLWVVLGLFFGAGVTAAQCKGSSGKSSGGPVAVKGYTRSNGTYVQPHMRSAPNGSKADNWSTIGNINPYTGKVGTRNADDSTVSTAPSPSTTYGTQAQVVAPSIETGRVADSYSAQKQRDVERAEYWKSYGYDFDPQFMTAATMDRKAEDYSRAQFWRAQGYVFDPKYMSASLMDRKVDDIRRAEYWKDRGYVFDPKYMSAHSMDRKVEDIKRAEYWKSMGYAFDPKYMSGYQMDRKVEDIKRAAYWKERGMIFDPQYMSAYAMDLQAAKALVIRP